MADWADEADEIPADATEDAVERATDALGEPDALYRPARMRAKLFLGASLLLIGLGTNYVWWIHGPGRIGHFEFHILFWPLLVGVGLLWHSYTTRGLRVLVYPTGLLRLRGGDAESFPWADITAVRLKGDPSDAPQFAYAETGEILACWLPLNAPTFQLWNTWLEVERADGTIARITPSLSDFPALAERVQRETFPYLWASARAKLAVGAEVGFGEYVATTAGLKFKKQFLKWDEIKEIAVSQKHVAVKRTGGWLAWAAKEASAVPNVNVLVALALGRRAEHRVGRSILFEPKADNG